MNFRITNQKLIITRMTLGMLKLHSSYIIEHQKSIIIIDNGIINEPKMRVKELNAWHL